MIVTCPLCGDDPAAYYSDSRRDYFQCQGCSLVFVDAEQRLNIAAEKAEYDLHQNCPNDKGYQQFLSRLVNPLLNHINVGAYGLDFGCGPGPAIKPMLFKHGVDVINYDPIYYPNEYCLSNNKAYDFITTTEVIEHVYQPDKVLPQLWDLLKSGGVLAIMTKLVIDKAAFSRWHYKNDPTHICFYSEETFLFIARQLNAKLVFVEKDVIFLFKSSK